MAIRTRIKDPEVMIGEIAPIKQDEGKLTQQAVDDLSATMIQLIDKINGGLSHGSGVTGHQGNFDEQFIDHLTPSVADTEFAVPHGLGRLPVGVEVARTDQYCRVKDSSSGSWDDKVLYLKCDVASVNLKLRVY